MRYELRLPEHVSAVLDRLVTETHYSRAEIVRMAVLTFETAVNEGVTSLPYVERFILESNLVGTEKRNG